MKRTMTIVAMVLLATGVHAADLVWEHDYDKALAAAKASNKLVLLDMYTDWCGWCKKLDRDVYSNADVQAKIAKSFIPLKLNPEKVQKGAELAGSFGLRGYPYIAFLKPDGTKLSSIEGYLPADQFGSALDDMAKQAGK